MEVLKEKIVMAQKKDKQSMMDLVNFFEPIIGKYTRFMRGDEDFREDMITYLIELVSVMRLSEFRIQNDYAIMNYVKNALYHRYIFLSKNYCRQRDSVENFDSEDMEQWIGVDTSTTDKIGEIMMEDLMKKTLTKREYSCVKLMVLDGYSSTQASKILGIGRQTVNSAKNRGLSKLRSRLLK